jgi:pyruvate/2-oxoglutarate dehydrogenase complex dihydrolipoamide dehydrogenase (E3) component
MVDTHYRFVIVGAGPAGLAAADFAARLGVSVALIERDRAGGDCTWTGCVPSKALLHAAEQVHAVRGAHKVATSTALSARDFPAAMAFVRAAIHQVYRFETPDMLAHRGIEVLHGQAAFLDPHTLEIAGRRITGQRLLIATGARPEVPAIPGLGQVPFLTSESVFDLAVLPSRLVILGAGPVGVELAQACQRLGSQVTLLDRDGRVAPRPTLRPARSCRQPSSATAWCSGRGRESSTWPRPPRAGSTWISEPSG